MSSPAMGGSASGVLSCLTGSFLCPDSSAATRPVQRCRVLNNCSGSIGLGTKSTMPASRQRVRSAPMALAVMAMIGVPAQPGAAWSSRVASIPFISGICMSIKMASKRMLCAMATTIFPLAAICTLTPTSANISRATCWLSSLSSASSTCSPESTRRCDSTVSALRGVKTSVPVESFVNRRMMQSNRVEGLTGLVSTSVKPSACAIGKKSSRE